MPKRGSDRFFVIASLYFDFTNATGTYCQIYNNHQIKVHGLTGTSLELLEICDQLQNHEAYIVNVVASFLSTYKDQLEPAIANLRKLLQSLKGYQYIIDPDEEFLHDIKRRVNIEQEYLDAEAKIVDIFNTVESIKGHFYTAIDDASTKDVEVINKLCDAIEKLERDFKINKRPILRIEIPTNDDLLSPSTGSPQGTKISSPGLVIPDFKSIFSQNLIMSSRKKPYIPLRGSFEDSPVSTMENDTKSTENRQHKHQVWESEKPYIPIGASSENSLVSTMENDTKSLENKQHKPQVWESEKPSHFDQHVSNPTLKTENKALEKIPFDCDQEGREQLQVSESQESKLPEQANTIDLDKDLVMPALKNETGINTETTEGGLDETSEASTAEHLSGNKKSVDPNKKLSKSDSGIEEIDQVSTEDIAGWECDEIVKEHKDEQLSS